MNKSETSAAILVMQAYVDGAEIEYRTDNFDWVTCTNEDATLCWDHVKFTYRIKPKEPRELWVCNANKPGGSGHYWISQKEKETGHWDSVKPVKFREVLDE